MTFEENADARVTVTRADIFDYLAGTIQSSDVTMVLDQYHPCFEFTVGLSTEDKSTSSTCEPSNGNPRDVTNNYEVEVGSKLSNKVIFEMITTCPTYTSSITDECESEMDTFEFELQTEVPSFGEFTNN
mmetsp:Transcript_14547/g.14166  ORF Transcript_14547/g.14166 Transcript_14547/m.14166 type:complete len:129 (-) Transcript_14547:1020-1406(-)